MLSEIKSLASHTNQINHMVVYKDKLISCSWDRTIKIWELNLEGKDAKLIRTLDHPYYDINYMVVYKNTLISCAWSKNNKIWNLDNENVEESLIHANNLIFYKGYLYGHSGKEIKILKYQPYFEDYQKATLTIFKIMNSSCISYQNKLYKGRFYKREVDKLMEMYDKYNTATTTNFSSATKISSNN